MGTIVVSRQGSMAYRQPCRHYEQTVACYLLKVTQGLSLMVLWRFLLYAFYGFVVVMMYLTVHRTLVYSRLSVAIVNTAN